MTLERQKLEIIREIAASTDEAVIRRLHQLVMVEKNAALEYSGILSEPNFKAGTHKDSTSETAVHSPPTSTEAISSSSENVLPDLSRYISGIQEKVDLKKIKLERPPLKHDADAFAKMIESIEWEQSVEELTESLRK